jgi:DNA-binding SARP family transcriptional activator
VGGARFGLQLLGGFELVVDGRTVPTSASSQRLLAFLALRRAAVPRPYVAGSLWPDATDQRAAANLRVAVWRTPAAADGLISTSAAHIRLAADVDVDHRRAIAAALAVLHDETPFEPAVDSGAMARITIAGSEAGGLLDADLLPGWSDEWVVPERERLRQLRLHALEARCWRLVERGASADAIDLGLTAVAAEPLRESAQRCLIGAHLAEGNLGEAIRVYESFRSRLWAALSLRPSPLMEELIPGTGGT